MALFIRKEALSSNPESPTSPLKDLTEVSLVEQDIDYSSKTYANELLEHGLKEERFRIDRKKLEDMLQVQQISNNAVEKAEIFFQRVMRETSTLVIWPSKLKIGAKSKKDPHVKIVGKPEAVQQAKDKILELLDTKKNRITLKMDVSHTDHSYIIGKGGFKIQQVMEETGCHIHFPDSNKPKRTALSFFKSSIADLSRNSTTEKSNQVSIAGQVAGVELARAKIRELLPFVYMFKLPDGITVNPGEESSPAIQHIQQTYSFNVAFRLNSIGRTVVIVRACQRLFSRLRQGLSLLMEFLTGSKTVPVMGFMKTEIAAQHHPFVLGTCDVNIQMIRNKTGAIIIFPNSAFSSESSQIVPILAGYNVLRSKSTIIIQGSFDSVFMAWQELLKCLPLVLMFDLKEGQELDRVMVNNFMEKFNINITVKPKNKESTKSVLISGTEKDSKVLFEVRKEILGLEEDISSSPAKPKDVEASSCEENSEVKNSMSNVAQNLSTAESISLLSAIIQQNPEIVGLLSNLSSENKILPSIKTQDVLPHPTLPNSVYSTPVQNRTNQILFEQYAAKRNVENWINQHGYILPDGQTMKRNLGDDDVDSADSGIYVHRRNRFQHVFESKTDVSSQPRSSASSTSSNDSPDNKVNAFFKRMSHSNEHTVGTDIHHLLAEYGNKKLSANKAMQQPIGDGVRTPTQLWAGLGFSKSMPDYAARLKNAVRNSGSISEYLDMNNSKSSATSSATWSSDLIENNDSPREAISSFCFSNFWENIPQQPAIDYWKIKNVEQLLNLLELQKYSEVLNRNEIDLITLLTLTDLDLQQLRISYADRRKILAAVTAILDHRLGDSLKNFRTAPDAERETFFARYPTGSSTAREKCY